MVVRMTDDDLSVFFSGVSFIVKDKGQWVLKHRGGFRESNPVLLGVVGCLLWIPLKLYTHMLTNNHETGGALCQAPPVVRTDVDHGVAPESP